jgi:LPS export ABC transporter protein LptC
MIIRRVLLSLACGFVVLGTVAWWWSDASEDGTPIASLQSAKQQPQGIRMEKFSLRDSQRHQTRWEILADVAHVDPKADTTRIEGVQLTLFSEKHGIIHVTAQQGVIDNQSRDMQVCGDVRLIVGQEFALSTECLQWYATEQALESVTPVAIDMGALQVQGRGFRGWIAEERFEIHERVLARWSEP